ncbi:hypothetical protein BZZ08_01112 [Streptomyces sp. MH60]|nr:hypothetical protein BZZ08_01112 [Streptomyces sp. MH60]
MTVHGTEEILVALKDGRLSATSRPGAPPRVTFVIPGPDTAPVDRPADYWDRVAATGRPAARQAWKPPIRSVARCRPRRCSDSAARLEA